jgi:hypothetical protein
MSLSGPAVSPDPGTSAATARLPTSKTLGAYGRWATQAGHSSHVGTTLHGDSPGATGLVARALDHLPDDRRSSRNMAWMDLVAKPVLGDVDEMSAYADEPSTGGTWAAAGGPPSPLRTQVTQSHSGIGAGGSPPSSPLRHSLGRGALADDETPTPTKIRGSDPGASGGVPIGLGSPLMRWKNNSNLSPHARVTTGGLGFAEGGAFTPTKSVAGDVDSSRLSAPGVRAAFERGINNGKLLGRAQLSLPRSQR